MLTHGDHCEALMLSVAQLCDGGDYKKRFKRVRRASSWANAYPVRYLWRDQVQLRVLGTPILSIGRSRRPLVVTRQSTVEQAMVYQP